MSMAQYIDKDALVEEIKSLWKHYLDAQEFDFGWNQALDKVLSYLDTLEVKEVDLEKEIDDWYNTMGIPATADALKETALHFVELGLNLQRNISIDVTNIDKIIEENGIDPNSKEAKMFKESYYMALEKLKTQKGE